MAREYDPESFDRTTTVCTSDRSGFPGLRVTIHDLPCAGILRLPASQQRGYRLGFRPRIEKGATRLTVPGSSLFPRRISRQCTVLIPTNHPRTIEWEKAAGHIAVFTFQAPYLESLAQAMHIDRQLVADLSARPATINDATEALCRLLMAEAGCPRGGKYFAELASALAVVVLDQIRATPGSGPPQTHYRVNQALKILETRYQSSLTVQTLARAVDLSPYHFTRVFRQHTGVAPYRYLIRLRLEHARRMMLQQRGKPSLVDVALASGFYDQTPFSRHFRHAFGVTPGEFLTRSKEASVEKGAL